PPPSTCTEERVEMVAAGSPLRQQREHFFLLARPRTVCGKDVLAPLSESVRGGNSALLQLLPRRPGRPRRGRRCAYGPSARLRVRDGRFARRASWVISTGQPALAFVDEIELREELTMDAGVENRIVVESERASQSGRAGVIEE